jgi:hypothetical protein
MDVQLASALDPAAEAERLEQWTADYGAAAGGLGGWLAPRRAAGERWQAVIRAVRWDEVDPAALADPGRLIAHRRARHPAPSAWMSPQRAIVADGRRAVASWRLDELTDVRALDDLTGVVLVPAGSDDRFPALLSDIVPWWSRWAGTAPPGYGLRRVDLDWLKFEAVFAARQDRLGQWARDLPDRLAALVRQAQEALA